MSEQGEFDLPLTNLELVSATKTAIHEAASGISFLVTCGSLRPPDASEVTSAFYCFLSAADILNRVRKR